MSRWALFWKGQRGWFRRGTLAGGSLVYLYYDLPWDTDWEFGLPWQLVVGGILFACTVAAFCFDFEREP